MAAKNLSKESLKNELIAHNIQLPPPGSKKEKFVELYEKHISPNLSLRSEFSSDEDDPGRSPKIRVKRSIFTSLTSSLDKSMDQDNVYQQNVTVDGLNISQLSDDELRQHLADLNVSVGPIVESTRNVYERKLARLLKGEVEGERLSVTAMDDEYSDSEDETESHHSANPHHSLRSSEIKHKENQTDTSSSTSKKKMDEESAFPRFNFMRDSPTPRRSLHSTLSYVATDRKLMNSYNRDSFFNNRKEELGKLASTVVEQIQEPVQPKKSLYKTMLMIAIILVVLLLPFLVYQNMEANGGDKVDKLPGSSEL